MSATLSKVDLLTDLRVRGLIKDVSNPEELEKHLQQERTVYCGFDPTADSLHIGNMVPLLGLKRAQQAGHKVIVLVGGATACIGDPGGRDKERPLQTMDTIKANAEAIRKQLEGLGIDFSNGRATLVNNYDWISKFDILTFLRDVGKHFPIGVMLGKEAVRARMEREDGLSYTEFSYMLLQGYDFHYLYKNNGCTFQMAGSDQWGNITAGIDFTRRMGGEEVFGLTMPLLTKSDGTKYGKSVGGAVWIDSKKTSPYAMYQFLLNSADADVVKLLNVYTFFSHDEIKQLAETLTTAPEKREAQRKLAEHFTTMIHGEKALAEAQKITEAFFSNDIKSLSESELSQVESGLPTTELQIAESLPVIDLLVSIKAAPSKSEARKLLEAGSVTINGDKVELTSAIAKKDSLFGKYFVIRKGKKNYFFAKLA
jgi:tyrosyl-tRNA synthetase